MDDMAKVRMYMDVDRRYLTVMPRTMVGRATENVIAELEAILSDYQKVLDVGPPQFPFYKTEDVQLKIADATEAIARSHEGLRQEGSARTYYEKAIAAYEALGHADKSARCRSILAQLIHSSQGDVDAEMNRLQSNLETAPPNTLEHAEALVALAELYSSQEDDFQAETLLLKAENELNGLGYTRPTGPSGTEMADALKATIEDVLSGKSGSTPTLIEIKLRARGLCRRIYLTLAQIYREKDVSKAHEYLQLLKAIDDKQGDDARDFTAEMSNSLASIMDSIDNLTKGTS